MAASSKCSTCGRTIGNDDKALWCDLCETWEHQWCVCEAERLNDELYECISTCSSKNILYVCTPCRNKGSLSTRLMKLELECARANEQWLASERLLEEWQLSVNNLLVDKQELIQEKNRLLAQLSDVKKLLLTTDMIRHVKKTEHLESADVNTPLATSPILTEDASSELSHEEETDRTSQPVEHSERQRHPPGFKDI